MSLIFLIYYFIVEPVSGASKKKTQVLDSF